MEERILNNGDQLNSQSGFLEEVEEITEKEPVSISFEGKGLVMITLRVLPETRNYYHSLAIANKLSLNEYLKRKIGILTTYLQGEETRKSYGVKEEIFINQTL